MTRARKSNACSQLPYTQDQLATCIFHNITEQYFSRIVNGLVISEEE